MSESVLACPSPRASPCRTSCPSWAGPSRSMSCGRWPTPASALCAPTTGTQVMFAVRFLILLCGPCGPHVHTRGRGSLLWTQDRGTTCPNCGP